jgi:hypothetical protein
MRIFASLLVLAVVAGAVGCGAPAQPKAMRLVPQAAPNEPASAAEQKDTLEALFSRTSVMEPSDTKYFSASEAPECPEVSVSTAQGKEISLGPGKRGFAEPGYVTLIVF